MDLCLEKLNSSSCPKNMQCVNPAPHEHNFVLWWTLIRYTEIVYSITFNLLIFWIVVGSLVCDMNQRASELTEADTATNIFGILFVK